MPDPACPFAPEPATLNGADHIHAIYTSRHAAELMPVLCSLWSSP